ncbi:MAG: hypothetical protein ACTSRJ_05700 [Candidatus Hodarchaeales archaeon]
MMKQRLRDNNSAYYAIKSLELSQTSSIKVAASMTTSVVKNVIRQVKEDYPEASRDELLIKVREILTLCE